MQELLLLLLASGVVFVLLLVGNQRVGYRYRQWWLPPLAFLFMLYGLYEYYSSRADILTELGKYHISALAELIVSLAIVAIFAIVKISINRGTGLFLKKDEKNTANQSVSRFSIAYKPDGQGQVVLRKEWVFTLLFLEYFVWFALGVFLFIILWQVLSLYASEIPVLPAFSALSLAVVLEVYWYLRHTRVEQIAAPPAAATAPPAVPVDYYQLWEEYQRIWFDKVLLAWHYKSPPTELIAPTSIDIIEAKNLQNAGYKLSVNDYHIIERLTNRNDLLIDDCISDNVAPLLFTVFLRRLMDGENILVLSSKRCYANSPYHQQIVKWINDWFFRLTSNRDFFKVQMFSKVEDVEMNSRIIVTSAEDILEKNLTTHAWFAGLHTVMFLNGDEIFTESLSANNMLLETLRDQYNDIQSIVLSDYREALQSSVARNLSVKSDLKEVRLRPAMPQKSFVIYWKLEGEQLFQHKVLSGHIEKFLGAEAVLALPARRERMQPVNMVGQEKLPYYEYLEELDNNTSSLLTTPVAARTLQDKGVKEVGHNETTFLLRPADNNLLLARDNDFNLPFTHRKWEAYSKLNAFVHVVSPPYLLRDYFIDNLEYFARTPLYALSSKMMVSRFETARALLERLVNQELSESDILQVLNRINPKAVFIKHELSRLFALAFGIDIIASNYLSIKTVYAFDKADDSYKRITTYRLQQRIKDDISLSFLRNVEIIDQARNVLKIMSYDLLFQTYLPDQTHAFGGKSYSIRGYDRTNRKLTVAHKSPEPIIAYRPDLEVTLLRIEQALTESHKKITGDEVEFEICEGAFEVQTKGYFSFITGISLEKNAYTYTVVSPDEVPVREYQLGRIATFTLSVPDTQIDIPRVTATLTVLLHEIFYTLFPETHQYVIVGSPVNELVIKGQFAKLYPLVRVKNSVPDLQERVIQLCILEDAFQDLGIVQSIFDKWDYILRIADDYLTWLAESNESSANQTTASSTTSDQEQIFRKIKFERLQFLKYGAQQLPEFIDLQGTSTILRQLLGNNFLSSERKAFYLR